MDQKITDILNILDNKESPSQREIAKETGISLGLVNTLLKKCAKKGLIKIERLNSRNIKYILTPAGIKEKTQKTITYVKKSYQAIKEIEAKVIRLALEAKKNQKEIYIYSSEKNDEILDLVSLILAENDLDYSILYNQEQFKTLDTQNAVLYHWDPELEAASLKTVNLFRS